MSQITNIQIEADWFWHMAYWKIKERLLQLFTFWDFIGYFHILFAYLSLD